MKSLTQLWYDIADESAMWCGTSITRDFEQVTSRVEHEGLSFLTITLANFGKDFQKSLDQGFVDSDQFAGFQRSGGLPKFLSGFLRRVFHRSTGRLLDDPCITSIMTVRQLTLMFSKIEVDCSPDRVSAAFDKYVECEKEIRNADSQRADSDYTEFRKAFAILFGDLANSLNNRVDEFNILPKHGPGKTADYIRGNAKWQFAEYTTRLESVFPMSEYLLPNHRYWQGLENLDLLEPGREHPTRVVHVPKNLKTPRIIAMEPVCMQYMQQGLWDAFFEEWSKDDYLTSLLGFDDQAINGKMACIGSIDGSLATLDLSEASDRVSNQLVRKALEPWPSLSEALDAVRSRKADVPGHGVIRLAKYASMGSAMCFPVEAMVFATVSFIGIARSLSRPVSRQLRYELSGRMRVFGDDIIVPTTSVSSVVESLETFGFKVNADKSFWTGKFRESCGEDYYDGHDVSITRVTQMFPQQRTHVKEVVATVSLRNALHAKGYRRASQTLDRKLTSVLRHFPVVEPTSSVLGRHEFLVPYGDRLHGDTHRPLVRGWVVRSRIPESHLDGSSALLKHFLKRGMGANPDPMHLERAGRPESVGMNLRWSSVY